MVHGVYNARGAHSRAIEEGGQQERDLAEKYQGWARTLRYRFPYVARILETIADTYLHDAEREDVETQVNKRLRL